MPATCTECRTSNRDGAKFCKGCGRRLRAAHSQEEWPATQRMSYRGEDLQLRGADAALAIPRRTRTVPPASVRPPAAPPRGREAAPAATRASAAAKAADGARPHRRNRSVFGVALAVVLIAAAGWYAIGSHQGVPAPAMPANPVVVPPPAPVPEPASPAPEPPTVISEPELAPEPRSVLAEPATPAKQLAAPRVRKPAVAPPAAPSAPAEAQAPAPAPAPEAAPPANPQALCGGLNFISRARCMAAQCAKPEFTAHPQCDAVRRQQQIEEEKRNPSLLN